MAQCVFICCVSVLISIFAFSVTPSLAQQSPTHQDWAKAMREINSSLGHPFEIDERRVAAAGIRKLSGKHIDLYTDVRETSSANDKKINELVGVFDRAVPQWCEYFDVDVTKVADWKMRVFLIASEKDSSRFKKAGLMPDDLPKFLAGFQRSHNAWLFLQPGTYYTRHLMIHEGTHGFMQWFAKGYGAPWYSEGMAELFGVHQWSEEKLELRYRLRDRSEAPFWGRVKRIKDEYASGKALTLTDAINIRASAYLEVRYYAWSWAACEFFSKHEKSKSEYEALKKMANIAPDQFNQKFIRSLRDNWNQLETDWELFISEIDYGYQPQRGRITKAIPKDASFGVSDSKFKIRSNQSWQTTSIDVKKGDRFLIAGSGEFKVGESSLAGGKQMPWPCQSNGVTIQYHRGSPLGMLHAGVFSPNAETGKERAKGLVNPISIGSRAEFTAPADGVLALRINESPSRMDDNEGGLEVVVEKLK
ncbi:MAG: hypothetical protein AB8B55_21195 [Mariniblastus sp.]